MPRNLTSRTERVRLELVAANLRYGAAAAPLRIRAYAQVVAKVLLTYPVGTPVKLERIRQGCRDILITSVPSREAVDSALSFLVEQQQADRLENGRFRLREKAWNEFRAQVTFQQTEIRNAVRRYFPVDDVDFDILARWFELTMVKLFSAFGDRWVVATSHGGESRFGSADVESLATRTAREVGLDDEALLLAWQLRRFLQSAQPEDTLIQWHFGRSMFAARIMAADLAADPISTREMAGGVLLFDTNLLIAIATEKPEFQPSIAGLGAALHDHGIRLYYTEETQDEFRRITHAWRETTLSYLDRYGYVIVKESADDDIQAAVRAGCVTRDEFARFYDQILQIPQAIGPAPLRLIDDLQIEAAVRRGAGDDELVRRIRASWAEQRGGTKRIAAAKHDAAVTTAAREFRARGEPCWVLSIDRTMQRLAIEWVNGSETPLWITVDTVLQILAVEEDGSRADATVFAPLLAQLVSNDVQASVFKYEIEDVQLLDEMLAGADSLPAQEVQQMARRIHIRRMTGTGRNDPELQHVINHMYQRVRSRQGEDVTTARELEGRQRRRADTLEEQNRELLSALRQQHVQERAKEIAPLLHRQLRAAFARQVLWWVLGFTGLAALILALLSWALPEASPDGKIGLVVTVLGWVGSTVGVLLKRILPDFRTARAGITERALELADEEEDPSRYLPSPSSSSEA